MDMSSDQEAGRVVRDANDFLEETLIKRLSSSEIEVEDGCWQREYETALKDLRSKADVLKRTAGENRQLKRQARAFEFGLQLSDREEQWLKITYPVERPISPHAGNLPRGLSFSELLHPDQWDASYVSQVRMLSTLQLATIHKQFLQECAMLLPKTGLDGANGDRATARMASMFGLYQVFSQRAISVVPIGIWRNR
jgi:hypothetical protein